MSELVGGTAHGIVHLVEDDAAARRATARFLRAAGYQVTTYDSGTDFLAAGVDSGCVILDLQLPGGSGLDIQRQLTAAADPLPVIFLSARAGIADSVQAMKNGAVDFLTKTADGADLLDAVGRALAQGDRLRSMRARHRELEARYRLLSRREREVFAHLISGQLNKQVGFDLGISLQTTKIHRHRVLEKMRADSIVELARMADDLGIAPVGAVR
jgi:FixJ family two-component response regulator